jgi:hypothetical protein
MNEAEWLACTDPTAVLVFLWGKASERKHRLFDVACCRRIWHLLMDERGRYAVELAEQSADSPIPPRLLDLASAEAWEASEDAIGSNPDEAAATRGITWDHLANAYVAASYASNDNLSLDSLPEAAQAAAEATPDTIREKDHQAALLRDIIGNPFRPVAVDPSWRTSTVVALANGVYQEKAFDRLPILADALEDAGCDSADVLEHLRGDGPHVRGCWVVDLLLGKK